MVTQMDGKMVALTRVSITCFRAAPTMKSLFGAARATGGLFRPSVSFRPLVRSRNSSVVEDVRSHGAVVVDKTMETASLLKPADENFLARPPKSGKSLALSTANAILSGKTQLFEGTKLMAAVEKGDPSVAHVARLWEEGTGVPVLHLDFSAIDPRPEVFEEELLAHLRMASARIGIPLSSSRALSALVDLFWTVEKRGQELAVLIDEYDQPMVKMLAQNGGEKDENANANLWVLHQFLGALKSVFGRNGYCLLMTAVSKFPRASLFSGINTITDQSFKTEHGKAFHFSWEEIVETYPRHLEALLDAREEGTMEELKQTMEKYYGGYSFSPQALERGSRLFNPFDVACLLAKPALCPRRGKFPDHWCGQDSLRWVAKHLDAGFVRQGLWSFAQNLDANSSLLNVEIKDLGKRSSATASLLQETGYLTFDEYLEDRMGRSVTLRPTNSLTQEVLQDQLLEVVVPEARLDEGLKRMQELFVAGDLLGVWQQVAVLLELANSDQMKNTAEAGVQWLTAVLLHKVEASGKITCLRETPVMHGSSDFIICYGPRNGEGRWRYGAVVKTKFMNATRELVAENASARQTTDSAPGDSGLESCTFLDEQLAKDVGGVEQVRKQVRGAFEQLREKNDAAVPTEFEAMHHAVVVWNSKAQVVAYSELPVEGL